MISSPTQAMPSSPRDVAGGHGRFAAPANAVRRQVQVKAINPRTADELAGFFRDVSYTLTDVRQGEAVPPIKVERVPDDLAGKDGSVRKALFITALLPVILEVNQRVLAEREQLLFLRDKFARPAGISPIERIWLEQLADRYEASADKLDELVRRVDIVPPSMAIAQSGSNRAGVPPSPRAPAMPCSARSSRSDATPSLCRGSRARACRSPSPTSARRPRPMSPISTRTLPTATSAASAR